MAKLRRTSHLDRILGRLEDLDTVNLTAVVQRLIKERSLQETVFNALQEGVLVVEASGLIGYANQSACELIGLKEDEIGRAILWKLVPELGRTLGTYFNKPSTARPMAISRELEITYPALRFLRLYFVPFTSKTEIEDGDEELFAVILTDITEDKASTQETIEKERMASITELAAGVAHEIGNPLNSIHIHLQLLRRTADIIEASPQRDKLERSIDVCAKEVERLDGIIKHFLGAIRPQQPNFQDISPIEVLTEVLEFHEHELKALGIIVEMEVAEILPVIQGDSDLLRQVFYNVVKNAMEAMDGGGKIRITARTDDEFLNIYVADSGKGIPHEDLTRIFKPFFTSKQDGHGLGMMVVQQIMRDHGGQIGIDSRIDTGTVVTLQFPQKHRRVRLLETS